MSSAQSHPNDPLHGVTLEAILRHLEQQYGFDGLADRIKVNCFSNDPSIKSCLKFFRKTPWAREKLERLYIKSIGEKMPDHLKTVAARKTPPMMPKADKPAATGSGENSAIWGGNNKK
ncbi:VF530 family DNA-binding protein [Shewanella mangrovi]|uniref:VF530 family protein n=1 Tax=Shewanella mangrovi TaxID=1515746 RepID=UPI00056506F2|nr:VF530 family protein [Shewanella mangrovi]